MNLYIYFQPLYFIYYIKFSYISYKIDAKNKIDTKKVPMNIRRIKVK